MVAEIIEINANPADTPEIKNMILLLGFIFSLNRFTYRKTEFITTT